ncbi:SLC13 family permease [Limibacter armeniacum]|uniref:SLC13 family permease n=1 Tax=Limibacter armeniacum TaxID=466084 RepID=UPI002FE67C03
MNSIGQTFKSKSMTATTLKEEQYSEVSGRTTKRLLLDPDSNPQLALWLKIAACVLIPILVLLIPQGYIPIEGMTIIQQRVLAIFVMATLLWILEPVPIYATSVLIVTMLLMLTSDKALIFMKMDEGPIFGALLPYKDILSTFASPIIMLFLGGFFLAMAATKYQLDQNLARVLLKPFGKKPSHVMLGLMLITALFSMFMSNTATTVMMLAILTPVLASLPAKEKGRLGFVLAIPIAANTGGIGTPIGTPPNAIAMKYLTGENAISFGHWMAFAVPFVMIILLASWFILQKFYPCKKEEITINIKGAFDKSPKAITVYVTFVVTILLWLLGGLHGMNAYVVAIIPVAVFTLTNIITKDDLKRISWDVLWLVTGGIAIGMALEKSGLASAAVASIPFASFSPYVVILSAAVLSIVMANFMSNTATANLLMPIVVALAISMESLIPYGGLKAIMVCVTFASSLGMALPISTPPNALAHATGVIQTKDLIRTGVLVGMMGLILTFILVYLMNSLNWL